MTQADGGDIYVKDWGKQDGPALLFIHGTTAHLGEFDVSLSATLADQYHMIAYDRPGMGRSTHRPAGSQTLAVQAETAADVIRAHAGGKKVIVVGHSYGGAVALRVAMDHPELVQGLVLLAPASHPWGGGAPGFYRIQAAPVIGEILTTLSWPISGGAARQSLKSRAFAPQPVPEGYFEKAEVKLALRPAAVRASAADFAALPAELEAQAPRYNELKLPIAIIAGEEDHIAPIARMVEKDRPAFANAKVTLLPGVGHMPQHAKPDLVESDIAWVLREAAK